MDKREFIKRIALLGLSTPVFTRLDGLLDAAEGRSSLELATDEDFWTKIRASYNL